MKMTIELPDVMFRHAKALAAARGVTLRRFFTEALEAQILHCEGDSRTGQRGPMAGFGARRFVEGQRRGQDGFAPGVLARPMVGAAGFEPAASRV